MQENDYEFTVLTNKGETVRLTVKGTNYSSALAQVKAKHRRGKITGSRNLGAVSAKQ